MSMNQHFKKRKSRTSSASASSSSSSSSMAARRSVGVGGATTTATLPPLFTTGVSVDAPSSAALAKSDSTTVTATSESATLAAALTALQVSLKRDLESFTPPTPAVSPAHRANAKRARFDFPGVDDCEPVPELASKVSPAPKARGALLAVSTRIKFELEKRLRRNSERSQRKRKQQLSYVAIIGAFHQAKHERERGCVTATSAAADTSASATAPLDLDLGLGLDCSVAVAADDRRW